MNVGRNGKKSIMVTQCTLPIIIIILDALLIQLFRYSTTHVVNNWILLDTEIDVLALAIRY